MNPILKEKIERHKAELAKSELHPETIERLQVFVDKVGEAANGHPDKLAALTDLVADLCLMKVEDRVRAPCERRKIIEAEVAKYDAMHDGKCPLMGVIKGRLAWLYVCRWPITACVGFLAGLPNGAEIIKAIRELWPT